MADKVEALREALNPGPHDPFVDGDVVSWRRDSNGEIAIKTQGVWSVSGRSQDFTFERLVQVLSIEGVHSIRVATSWEFLEEAPF